jgi:K+-sensing histidine kinase KdpD
MNGQLTLYRDQYGIVPVALSLIAILWTTIVLIAVHSMMDDDPEHLALAYLLPTIFIAIFFGSALAIASTFVSGLAAAYFIYPPKFNLYIADPRHVAELGFILLLGVIASKVVGILTEQAARKLPPPEHSEPGILVAVGTGNFLHEHHDPAPQGGIIDSHERSDQP